MKVSSKGNEMLNWFRHDSSLRLDHIAVRNKVRILLSKNQGEMPKMRKSVVFIKHSLED